MNEGLQIAASWVSFRLGLHIGLCRCPGLEQHGRQAEWTVMESVHDGFVCCVCARRLCVCVCRQPGQGCPPKTKSNKLSCLGGCIVEAPIFLAVAFDCILKPVRALHPLGDDPASTSCPCQLNKARSHNSLETTYVQETLVQQHRHSSTTQLVKYRNAGTAWFARERRDLP